MSQKGEEIRWKILAAKNEILCPFTNHFTMTKESLQKIFFDKSHCVAQFKSCKAKNHNCSLTSTLLPAVSKTSFPRKVFSRDIRLTIFYSSRFFRSGSQLSSDLSPKMLSPAECFNDCFH